jgi:hypothetical protein
VCFFSLQSHSTLRADSLQSALHSALRQHYNQDATNDLTPCILLRERNFYIPAAPLGHPEPVLLRLQPVPRELVDGASEQRSHLHRIWPTALEVIFDLRACASAQRAFTYTRTSHAPSARSRSRAR